MNLKDLLNAVSAAAKDTRAGYQMTIGKAIVTLEKLPPDATIQYEDGKAPSEAMSYRGYYSDLAFDDQDSATVGEVLAQLNRVSNTELTGYKGGENFMGDDTPIWRSEYGEASGVAWMGIEDGGGFVTILTQQID